MAGVASMTIVAGVPALTCAADHDRVHQHKTRERTLLIAVQQRLRSAVMRGDEAVVIFETVNTRNTPGHIAISQTRAEISQQTLP